MYAEIKIGDTCIMMEEDYKISHSSSLSLWVYVRDVDATYEKALKAVANQFKSQHTSTHGIKWLK